jgi:hypothetical protein
VFCRENKFRFSRTFRPQKDPVYGSKGPLLALGKNTSNVILSSASR